MEIISLVLSIIGAATLAVYLVRWYLYSPRVFIRIGGEQGGEPILAKAQGKLYFAIGTRSKRRVVISGVWASCNDAYVGIGAKGARQILTIDSEFPLAVVFSDRRVVSRMHLQGNYVNYRAKGRAFAIKIEAISEVDETEHPFLVDMFAPRKAKTERVILFNVDPQANRTLQESGLALHPGEALHMEGVQAQDEVWAAADKGEAKLDIREVIEGEEGQL